MYGYYFDLSGIAIFMLIVLAVVLIAWIMAISLFVEIAKDKGYCKNGAGALWFIGIFATPIAVGLYVAALPDRNALGASSRHADVDNELPSI